MSYDFKNKGKQKNVFSSKSNKLKNKLDYNKIYDLVYENVKKPYTVTSSVYSGSTYRTGSKFAGGN